MHLNNGTNCKLLHPQKYLVFFIGDILSLVAFCEVRNMAFCNKLQAESSQCCKRLGSSAVLEGLLLAVSMLQRTQVPRDGDGT
jgi:hypothetical protein